MIKPKRIFLYLFLVLFILSSLGAQEAKKPLTLEDYTLWKHIVSPLISADGRWISYSLRPNGGDITLFFKEINSEKIHEIAYATRPQFSEDGKWAAYQKGVSKKRQKNCKRKKSPSQPL